MMLDDKEEISVGSQYDTWGPDNIVTRVGFTVSCDIKADHPKFKEIRSIIGEEPLTLDRCIELLQCLKAR